MVSWLDCILISDDLESDLAYLWYHRQTRGILAIDSWSIAIQLLTLDPHLIFGFIIKRSLVLSSRFLILFRPPRSQTLTLQLIGSAESVPSSPQTQIRELDSVIFAAFDFRSGNELRWYAMPC